MAHSTYNIKSFFQEFKGATQEISKDAKDLKNMVDRPVFAITSQDQNSIASSSLFYTSSLLESLNEKVEFLEKEEHSLRKLPGFGGSNTYSFSNLIDACQTLCQINDQWKRILEDKLEQYGYQKPVVEDTVEELKESVVDPQTPASKILLSAKKNRSAKKAVKEPYLFLFLLFLKYFSSFFTSPKKKNLVVPTLEEIGLSSASIALLRTTNAPQPTLSIPTVTSLKEIVPPKEFVPQSTSYQVPKKDTFLPNKEVILPSKETVTSKSDFVAPIKETYANDVEGDNTTGFLPVTNNNFRSIVEIDSPPHPKSNVPSTPMESTPLKSSTQLSNIPASIYKPVENLYTTSNFEVKKTVPTVDLQAPKPIVSSFQSHIPPPSTATAPHSILKTSQPSILTSSSGTIPKPTIPSFQPISSLPAPPTPSSLPINIPPSVSLSSTWPNAPNSVQKTELPLNLTSNLELSSNFSNNTVQIPPSLPRPAVVVPVVAPAPQISTPLNNSLPTAPVPVSTFNIISRNLSNMDHNITVPFTPLAVNKQAPQPTQTVKVENRPASSYQPVGEENAFAVLIKETTKDEVTQIPCYKFLKTQLDNVDKLNKAIGNINQFVKQRKSVDAGNDCFSEGDLKNVNMEGFNLSAVMLSLVQLKRLQRRQKDGQSVYVVCNSAINV